MDVKCFLSAANIHFFILSYPCTVLRESPEKSFGAPTAELRPVEFEDKDAVPSVNWFGIASIDLSEPDSLDCSEATSAYGGGMRCSIGVADSSAANELGSSMSQCRAVTISMNPV